MNANTAFPKIVIPVRRSRIPILFFFGISASAFFLFLFITDDRSLPFFYLRAFYLVLLGYAGTITTISLLDYLKTVFDKNASLVLSDKTLEDHLSILSCGSVPWGDVSGVAIKKTKGFNLYFLVVTLTDDDKYLKNKNPVLRFFLKKYIRIYGGIMVISDKRIRYDIQKLRDDIFERFHHQVSYPDTSFLSQLRIR
jgi:hypothetical protein